MRRKILALIFLLVFGFASNLDARGRTAHKCSETVVKLYIINSDMWKNGKWCGWKEEVFGFNECNQLVIHSTNGQNFCGRQRTVRRGNNE